MSKLSGIVAMVVAALLMLNAVSALRQWEAIARAEDASANLHHCGRLSEEIEQLRKQETVAAESSDLSSEMGTDLLQLTTKAGIGESRVLGIERMIPEPVSGTEYERDDAVLRLSGLTMKQVVSLLILVGDDDRGLSPTSMTLRPDKQNSKPDGREPGHEELWDCQLILTRLVFAATSQTRG